MSDKDELLTGNYDGIEEFDNDLPKWWVQLFIITIVYSGVYVFWVHVKGYTPDEEVAKQEVIAIQQVNKSPQQEHQITNETLLASFTEQSAVEKGKSIYTLRCAPCHGQNGEGLVGPNLTDEFWLHGSSPLEVKQVIDKGVPAKGMLAWKGVLKDEEITTVLAFLWSIRNKNVPGKAPQGEKAST